mmetsp:Transcript_41935/g.115664  ORF Transcript_41935/g.115664 Transcript_41935/m.115664 type:complete len:237 (-) Transcript_41935:155-865(-)
MMQSASDFEPEYARDSFQAVIRARALQHEEPVGSLWNLDGCPSEDPNRAEAEIRAQCMELNDRYIKGINLTESTLPRLSTDTFTNPGTLGGFPTSRTCDSLLACHEGIEGSDDSESDVRSECSGDCDRVGSPRYQSSRGCIVKRVVETGFVNESASDPAASDPAVGSMPPSDRTEPEVDETSLAAEVDQLPLADSIQDEGDMASRKMAWEARRKSRLERRANDTSSKMTYGKLLRA